MNNLNNKRPRHEKWKFLYANSRGLKSITDRLNKNSGSNKNQNKKEAWRFFYANSRGLQSKSNCIIELMAELKPHVALFTETHQKTNTAFKIQDYTFFGKTRKEKSSGGVGILVRNELKQCISPHTTNRNIEIAWISIKRRRLQPVYIGVYYGKQESRVNKDEIEEEMEILMEEIMEMKNEGEVMILMDGNGKIGILGEPISRNGRMLLEVFENTQMQIMNMSEKCQGKITRRATKKNESDSAIDFVIASNGFSNCITRINIDEDGLYRLQGKAESDHNSIVVDANLSDIARHPNKKSVIWRMGAPEEAWIQYRNNLEAFVQTSLQITKDKQKTVQHRYNLWMNGILAIINRTIGKTTIKGGMKEKYSKKVVDLRQEKRSLKKQFLKENDKDEKQHIKEQYKIKQQTLQKAIQEERMRKTEEKFQNMIKSKSSNEFWKERKKIQRDDTSDWMITKDNDGKRLYDPHQNMENMASYYENLYRRKWERNHEYHIKVDQEMKEYKKNRDYENVPYNEKPSLEMIVKVIDNKKNKKSTTDLKNEFLKRGGNAIIKAVHHVINMVWDEESIPSQWNESHITSIWKNKGDKEMMNNHRGISVSSTIGMIMEEILNDRILESIQFTQAQGGGIKNYSTCDHVFLVRALISCAVAMRQKYILTFYDVKKAYDHAERDDMMYILWQKGVRGKMWRLTCALNNELTAKIKTPYGFTRQIKREVGGKQGGKIMTTTFAKLMDLLPEEMLQDHEMGVEIENVRIPALLFVDDVTTIATNYTQQQKTLNQVDEFAKKHCMEWGADKCAVMEIGKHSNVYQSWSLGGEQINHVNQYKYLGDIISRDGKNIKNIEQRLSKIKASTCSIITCATNEIMQKIEVNTLLKLHEAINIPILLHNSETWILTKTENLQLERAEMWALKKMLSLPKTTPTIAVRYVTGKMFTRIRIDIKQLMFLWKTLQRSTESWLFRILHTLDDLQIGWARQIHETLREYSLTNDWTEIKSKTKQHWKQDVYKAAENKNKEMMLMECYKDSSRSEVKTKTKTIIEKLERPDYQRIQINSISALSKLQAKAIIMGRYGMLDCASNYKVKYGSKQCRECKCIDDEYHRLFKCPRWNDITQTAEPFPWSEIYEGESEKLIIIAQKILEKWDLLNGNNKMR